MRFFFAFARRYPMDGGGNWNKCSFMASTKGKKCIFTSLLIRTINET